MRFIELTHAYKDSKTPQWDQHGYLVEGLRKNAVRVDQPISALLAEQIALGEPEITTQLNGTVDAVCCGRYIWEVCMREPYWRHGHPYVIHTR